MLAENGPALRKDTSRNSDRYFGRPPPNSAFDSSDSVTLLPGIREAYASPEIGLIYADNLYRAIGWRIFVQWPVDSDVVIAASIGSQNPAQMCLTQDDDTLDTRDGLIRSTPVP